MNSTASAKPNITFTHKQMCSINDMAVEFNTTKAGVLRAALALLQTVIEEEKKDRQIAITKDGEIIKIITGITSKLPTAYGGSN